MTPTKAPPPNLIVNRVSDSAVEVFRKRYVYRYLFDDGTTLDVTDTRDDSDAREAVRVFAGKERIVGVATLPDQGALL